MQSESLTNHRNIDTERAAASLREKVLDLTSKRILISRLSGSQQANDLSVPPNCDGLGRIRHFNRATASGWPDNPLPIDPACKALGLDHRDTMEAQVFQINGCAWRCWYCYVPYVLLRGDEHVGEWLSAEELVDLYLKQTFRPVIIDISGGSPDLTPEWVLWMMDALRSRRLERDVYLWSDDNLSTDFLWQHISNNDLQSIAEYPNYGRVACFKGFDEESFAFNTQASSSSFGRQFEIMQRLVSTGIDCYSYATFTGPSQSNVAKLVSCFVDRLQGIHHNLPLRTIPLQICTFTPMKGRLTDARSQSLQTQEAAIAAWNEELYKRFSGAERSVNIALVPIGHA